MPGHVAVIVPAYQAAAYLTDTLASVTAQTYPSWTCWVVDDGSTDGTPEIAAAAAAADPRIHVIRQANAGPHRARNAALEQLPADVGWVALLDSDDLWLPDALEILVAAAERRPDAVGVHGLAEYVDAEGRPIRPGAHPAVQRDRRRPGLFDLVAVDPQADSTSDSLAVSGTIWPPAVALLRREIVDRVGRFDAEQRLVEDWDLYLRMSRSGPFIPVDRQVAWYRQHGTNVTHRSDRVAFSSLQVRRKAFDSGDDTPAQHVLSRRVWRRLVLRWSVWTTQAAARHLRHREPVQAVSAAVAVGRFLPTLVGGRPHRADLRLAATTARYVSERAFNPRTAPVVSATRARGWGPTGG